MVAAWRVARGLWFVGLAAAALAVSTPIATTTRAPAPQVQLVRIGGGHGFGGLHFGGNRLRGSRPSIGRTRSLGRSRSRGILRSIAHALAFAALLHFLFAGSSGLGFIVLALLIFGLFTLMRRRRRRYHPRY